MQVDTMNNYCKIEVLLKEKLENNNNQLLFADYELTREYLFKDVYPQIGSKLPDYTYHDGSHVIQVLNNICSLIEDVICDISCETLYFLCLSVLFHDVGLIYGREEHQKNIGDIYNNSPGRSNIHKYGNERIIITKTVEAHSGKAIDNTHDTLKYLGPQLGYNEMINTQKIAAMLKFADELAEGGQRTSDFFIKNGIYKKSAKIYHLYSQAYRSVISTKNGRLEITYTINFFIAKGNILFVDKGIELKKFLNFIFDRLVKLDEERKYCRYYCSWLDALKEISVNFNFWYNGEPIEIGLPPIIFSDKIVPYSSKTKIDKSFPDYTYSNIDIRLRKSLSNKSKEKRL